MSNNEIKACKLSHAEELLEDIKSIIEGGHYSPGETPEDENFLVLEESDAG